MYYSKRYACSVFDAFMDAKNRCGGGASDKFKHTVFDVGV